MQIRSDLGGVAFRLFLLLVEVDQAKKKIWIFVKNIKIKIKNGEKTDLATCPLNFGSLKRNCELLQNDLFYQVSRRESFDHLRQVRDIWFHSVHLMTYFFLLVKLCQIRQLYHIAYGYKMCLVEATG